MILSSLGWERRETVNPAHPRDPALGAMFGFGMRSAAGVAVSGATAQTSVTVMSCVRVLSETVGQLPLILYERTKDDGRERATKHRLYRILRRRPNAFQTATEWKQMMQGHTALRGNGYSEIVSSGQAAIEELIPLHPDRVTPFWVKRGVKAFRYQDPFQQKERIILQSEMFHLMGLPSGDGLKGISPIEAHRNSIGLDLAQEEFAGAQMMNGASVGGVLKAVKPLGVDGLKNLRTSLDEYHSGPRKAGRFMILEDGLDWTQIGMNSRDAQFLEQRKFSVAQIARIFRVPPHLVGDLEKATFSNIEQQALEFVKFTMMPWFVRWEEAVTRDLLLEREEETHFAEFLVDALLRGDLTTRFQAYAKGILTGWLSVNDVRRMENMNPIDGGNVYLTPTNMVPTAGEDVEQVLAQLKEMLGNGGN